MRGRADGEENGSSGVRALRRGLSLLTAFDPAEPELRLTELARRTRIPVPTASRLLKTLVDSGFLERDARSQLYRPAIAALRVGHMGLASFGPRDVAYPFLRDLQRRAAETVSMGVLVGTTVVLVERIASSDLLGLSYQVASRLPAHSTGLGKVLLADLRPEQVRELYPKAGSPGAPAPANVDALIDHLASVAELGIAFSNEETSEGVRSVAAPVRNSVGRVVAAISVSGRTYRVSLADLHSRLGALCSATAAEVSLALGYRPASSGHRPRS